MSVYRLVSSGLLLVCAFSCSHMLLFCFHACTYAQLFCKDARAGWTGGLQIQLHAHVDMPIRWSWQHCNMAPCVQAASPDELTNTEHLGSLLEQQRHGLILCTRTTHSTQWVSAAHPVCRLPTNTLNNKPPQHTLSLCDHSLPHSISSITQDGSSAAAPDWRPVERWPPPTPAAAAPPAAAAAAAACSACIKSSSSPVCMAWWQEVNKEQV